MYEQNMKESKSFFYIIELKNNTVSWNKTMWQIMLTTFVHYSLTFLLALYIQNKS